MVKVLEAGNVPGFLFHVNYAIAEVKHANLCMQLKVNDGRLIESSDVLYAWA